MMLAGGSPRYQLYPTKDGKIVACGALEQKFWHRVHALRSAWRRNSSNDLSDPKATRDAVAKLIAARTADEWRPIFAAGRLLRDHRGAAGAGNARSAFR